MKPIDYYSSIVVVAVLNVIEMKTMFDVDDLKNVNDYCDENDDEFDENSNSYQLYHADRTNIDQLYHWTIDDEFENQFDLTISMIDNDLN